MNKSIQTALPKEERRGTVKSYTIGFILSVVLTLIAFFLVMEHVLPGYILVTAILILAFLQLIVQMLFFLHLKQEAKPRLNLIVFISFACIILIVVIASLWIMQHLNYNMNLLRLNDVMQYGEGF